MTVRGRKAEVKKSLPYIVKSHTYMVFVVMITWAFARYVVNYYNPGAWPNVGVIRMAFDFWKEIAALGFGISALTTIFELFRKRNGK